MRPWVARLTWWRNKSQLFAPRKWDELENFSGFSYDLVIYFSDVSFSRSMGKWREMLLVCLCTFKSILSLRYRKPFGGSRKRKRILTTTWRWWSAEDCFRLPSLVCSGFFSLDGILIYAPLRPTRAAFPHVVAVDVFPFSLLLPVPHFFRCSCFSGWADRNSNRRKNGEERWKSFRLSASSLRRGLNVDASARRSSRIFRR